MKKQEIIFVPAPGIGHIVSTLEFAKLLLHHHDRVTITVLVLKIPFSPYLDSYIEFLTSSQSRIQLVNLPDVVPPPLELLTKSSESYIYALIQGYIPHVRSAVADILSKSRSNSDSIRVAALVLDFFCVPMIDIGNEFGLPSYIFLTSNAGFLNLMLYLPGRHKRIEGEFKDSNPEELLHGFVNPVPSGVLPSALFNKEGYAAYINFAERFRDAKGIVVNTFEELESYAMSSLKEVQAPPVYPVGPVLNLKGCQPHPEFDQARWEEIKKWLDEQPESSVLFLCFGSFGSFNASQVKELAFGVERSGFSFLWALRAPSNDDENDFKNPEEMLPAGFLERIGRRGMICRWALQVEVLDHVAIGGFLSHCGWNSILESLWQGVPVVTLPIYAEQQMNAFLMVKELGLGVELRLDYREKGHLVTAEEIERAVKCVMESDGEVRKKVKEMREISKKAVMEGGSSYNSIELLLKDIMTSPCSS